MARSRSRPRRSGKRTSPARKKSTRRRSTRRRTAAGRRRQRRWVGLLVVVLLALGGYAATQEDMRDLLPSPAGAGEDAGGQGPGADEVDADLARQRLDELTVADWEPMRGYRRDRFPHWRTVDGCDARQQVLARDGEDIDTEANSCHVVAGTWHSAFDGVTLTDPSEVDIDHVVPLAAAWRAGANEWDDERRADFANDLDNPQLIAVSATSNRAKGDQDPSQWRPPERGHWCQYAHDWVAVKHHWQLTITEPERDAITDMLDTCP